MPRASGHSNIATLPRPGRHLGSRLVSLAPGQTLDHFGRYGFAHLSPEVGLRTSQTICRSAGRFGSEIETQAAYWRRCITAARGAGLGRPDYVELRYEDLILRPRETLERICPPLDLRYDEAMTQYPHRTRERLREHKGRSSPDGKLLVTQQDRLRQQGMTMHPPDPRRIGVWKTQMNAHERERFHRVAGGLLRELGYET